jgi:hypothetical protein
MIDLSLFFDELRKRRRKEYLKKNVINEEKQD